jgi:hypothetical protein
MPVASLRWQLSEESVRETPDQQGVFTLWDGDECVYIGHTPWNTSLRDRLRHHLALRAQGVIDASHFTWEVTPVPKTRQGDLLGGCVARQGKPPRYNAPESPLRAPQSSITDLRARGQAGAG